MGALKLGSARFRRLESLKRSMPKKVPFRVVYCTGWEDDYPPKDLEVSAWEIITNYEQSIVYSYCVAMVSVNFSIFPFRCTARSSRDGGLQGMINLY